MRRGRGRNADETVEVSFARTTAFAVEVPFELLDSEVDVAYLTEHEAEFLLTLPNDLGLQLPGANKGTRALLRLRRRIPV